MAIAFFAAGADYQSSANANTHAFDMPDGDLTGKVCYMDVTVNGASNGVDTPSGWAYIEDEVGSTTIRTYVFRRVCDGSEGASVTVTLSAGASVQAQGGILAYSGVDTATPEDVTPTTFSGTSGTTCTAPDITPTSSGTRILRFWSVAGGSTGGTLTPPGDHTERLQAESAGTAKRPTMIGDIAGPAAGVAAGTAVATHAFGGTPGVLGISVALREAAAPPAEPTVSRVFSVRWG